MLYKIHGARRSVKQPVFSAGLEAANPTNIFLFSKLIETRARDSYREAASEFVFFGKYKLLIFVQNTQLLIG
jgi:hypothetical protein